MSIYKALLAKHEAMETDLATARAAEIEGVLDGICEVMALYKLTLEDVAQAMAARAPSQARKPEREPLAPLPRARANPRSSGHDDSTDPGHASAASPLSRAKRP